MSDGKELPRAERCETCRWWELDEYDDKRGECRKHAPSPAVSLKEWTATPAACWPITFPNDWCGEWRAKEGAVATPATYTTSVPFQKLLDLISTRAANCIESEGTNSWQLLFANREDHPKEMGQPNEYRNMGPKTFLEMLLAMAALGVKAPSRWDIPKIVKSEFVKAGGDFFDGEYQPATVAQPPPAVG